LRGTLVNTPGITLDGSRSFSSANAFPGSLGIAAGGTILGGSVTTTNGAALVGIQTGDLDGVTINGVLDMSQFNATTMFIDHGLTLNGTVLLGDTNGANYGRLLFTGNNTLTTTSSGQVLLGADYSNAV